MRFQHLAMPLFHQAFQHLLELELPIAQAYRLSQISETVAKANTRYNELRLQALAKHANVAEDGGIASDEFGQAVFATPEAAQAFQDELVALQAEPIELPARLMMAELSTPMTAVYVGILADANILVP